ncbi:hypothetical protein ACF0H5_016186 [Mactra antiquata]
MTLTGTSMISLLLLYLCLYAFAADEEQKRKCPCDDAKNCNPITDWDPKKQEVVVISNQSMSYTLWKTDAFTSVIEWNYQLNDNVMCYTHSVGKKYGTYKNIKTLSFDSSDADVQTFVKTHREYVQMQFADMLALDLIDLLGKCDNAGQHVDGIINVTTAVISGIKDGTNTKVLCVMPWKPPCFNSNCKISPSLAKVCDGMIISPESYTTYCDESCTAKATMGYGKILYGLSEYLASGWEESQVLLGIPWHGYNYTCNSAETLGKGYLCHLKKVKVDNTSDVTRCDIEGSRKKISIGDKLSRPGGVVDEIVYMDGNFSEADWTPWIIDIVQSGDKSTTYMTWYEDIGSLMRKYEIVHDHKLKGSVIFTVDDLTYTDIKASKQFNDNMWAWLLHSILSTSTPSKKKDANLNMSGMMAGIGVGMFILGTLLGIIFSCIVFRRRKGLKPPFSRDPLADEFRDDDDTNQL